MGLLHPGVQQPHLGRVAPVGPEDRRRRVAEQPGAVVLLLADDHIPHRVDLSLGQQPLIGHRTPAHRLGAVAQLHHRLGPLVLAVLAAIGVLGKHGGQPLTTGRRCVGVRSRRLARREHRVRRCDGVVVGRLVLHEQDVLAEARLAGHVHIGVEPVGQLLPGHRVGPGGSLGLHHQRAEQAVRIRALLAAPQVGEVTEEEHPFVLAVPYVAPAPAGRHRGVLVGAHLAAVRGVHVVADALRVDASSLR